MSVRLSSPLRYPGGKSSFADVICSIRKLNNLGDTKIIEPFAGGAGASLNLLASEETHAIHINDKDKAIYSFWWTLLHNGKLLIDRINQANVTIGEWKKQRDVYRSQEASRFDLGFATFFLNRCNRSGIIFNGGPIGGHSQNGSWKIDARFNKNTLVRRCLRISEFAPRISISNLDALTVIRKAKSGEMLFIDPPYFQKGQLLYLNAVGASYHRRLRNALAALQGIPWILTYDDCPEIRELYSDWASVRPFALKYAAAVTRSGRELVISPRWLKLPQKQRSMAISW